LAERDDRSALNWGHLMMGQVLHVMGDQREARRHLDSILGSELATKMGDHARKFGLEVREFDTHFNSDQTGFSTVRRSLGAILKEQLQLVARPRGTGTSKANYTNYCFNLAGEDRLTTWMREHLKVRTWPTRKFEAIEAILKPRLRPLLNLEGWNPQNSAIRALRKRCADEARLQRQT